MALRFLSSPNQAQELLLRRLLKHAKKTEWGRRYDFRRLSSAPDLVSEFEKVVPTHSYQDYRSDIMRVRAGEKNVIWPGSFFHFAISSGTVSAGNIIPVSREMLLKNRSFSYLTARQYLRATGDFDILFGKLLSVPGRVESDLYREKTLVGEVSGLLASFSPFVVRWFLEAIPRDIQNLSDWEEKLNAIVDQAVNKDVRSIAMVPTWAIVLFEKLIARYNQDHSRSATTVREVWPNLKVFFTGGVALSSYRELLDQLVGRKLNYVESYGASEGFFSFQNQPNQTDMLLHLDNGVYFEFVRIDDSTSTPRRFAIPDVEIGVPYSIFVSTCSGLWSYGVGDIVEFTSLSPHRIVVTGRTNEVLDKYGEALFGKEAGSALEFACQQTECGVRGYHIAPLELRPDRAPGHQWFIEFDGNPPSKILFSKLLDDYVRSINRHYAIRRDSGAFSAPDVAILPRGSFYAWLQISRENVSAQSKVPRMSTDREIADQLLLILRKNTFFPGEGDSN